MTSPGDAIGAARGLTEALNGVRDDIQGLRRYGHVNRVLTVIALVALLAAVASIAIALSASSDAEQAQHRADRAYARVVAAHESQIAACRTGNQIRRSQVQFWQFLVDLSLSKPPPHLTARQISKNKRELAVIIAHAHQSFPQLDCANIYKLPRGG